MKNKGAPERGIEKYNYLKSIKDKEQQILAYYKKINHSNTNKPIPIPKKKRTKKNKLQMNIIKPKGEDEGKNEYGYDYGNGEVDNETTSEEDPLLSIITKKERQDKLTKKKQFVIMD